MSVSKAILSGNYKDLELAIAEETNEVYSTLLFDSYDDKRIEELLFLEALEIMKETQGKKYEFEHRLDLKREMIEYKDSFYRLKEPFRKVPFPKEFQTLIMKSYNESSYSVVPPEDSSVSLYLNLDDKHYKKLFYDSSGTKWRTEDEFNKYLESNECDVDFSIRSIVPLNTNNYGYSDKTMYFRMTNPDINYWRYCVSHYISTNKSKFPQNEINVQEIEYVLCVCHLHIYDRLIDVPFGVNLVPVPSSDLKAHDFLLKRLCERHALNEHLVSSMKKKLEVERLYYHMKDISIEDAKLTQEVNAKHEQLNTLNEDICSRKLELRSIENRIINAQNELEASIKHLKSFEISNEIEYENSFLKLSTEDQHILECKNLHEYYIQNANDLKIYRLAFNNMREISIELEREKNEFEVWKDKQTSEMKAKIRAQEEELKRREKEFEQKMKKRESQFDSDCETYELESTKWKSQMESKFKQYQERINNYPKLKDDRDRLKQEVSKLKEALTEATKERDEYKTTIDTLMKFRK